MDRHLKPCPFCGGEARLVVCDSEGNVHDESYEADPYSGLSYAIVHGSDDCCGECPVSTSDPLPWLYETREEAVAAWNRRSEQTCRMDAPIDGEYRCEQCGHLNRDTYRASRGWFPPEYCAHCGAKVVGE